MRRIFEQILSRPGTRMALVHATSKVLGLALGIFVARVLGAESYGIYTYTLAWMALLSAIGSAGVPRLLMREIAAARAKENWHSVRADTWRGTALVLVLSCSIAALGGVALLLFGDTLTPDVLATTAGMLVLLPLAVLVTLSSHILQGLQKVVTGMWVELVMRPACMLMLLVIAVFGLSIELTPAYAMLTQIAGALLTLALALALVTRALPSNTRQTDDASRAPRAWLN
ncbi:MAG: oligosaccharide flippase family protein, partial [Pseudomonadota bacterium]